MPQTTVLAAAAAPDWKAGAVSQHGMVRRFRVNTALRYATDTSLYPVRLEVAVPLTDPGWGGLPTAAEAQRLARAEENVLAAVAGRAVLAAVVTAAGGCWFILYTDTADWATGPSGPLQRAAGAGARVLTAPDPAWQTYRSLRKGARQKILGWAVLGATRGTLGPVRPAACRDGA